MQFRVGEPPSQCGDPDQYVRPRSTHARAARAESFFKTLKCEEVYVHHYQTFEEAQAHLQTFLEDVYNAKRLHSSLEYVPPDEFEADSLKC